MKPENWEQLSNEEKKAMALELLSSMRGHYIMSQALVIARKELSKIESPHKEQSNIEDMEILIEGLFPIFVLIDKTSSL